uniref:Dehydrogenase/reductase SDR family member 11 n=1 Tax=Timema bartmani TaxID=61472 RepID=A0A7R9FB65_9NEOP|nr:unnamed protein product [Timema bartmani]
MQASVSLALRPSGDNEIRLNGVPSSEMNSSIGQESRDRIRSNALAPEKPYKLMKEKGVDDGHIIHINSVAGHTMVNFPGIVPYTASKHAVTVLTEGLRRELVQLGSKDQGHGEELTD